MPRFSEGGKKENYFPDLGMAASSVASQLTVVAVTTENVSTRICTAYVYDAVKQG